MSEVADDYQSEFEAPAYTILERQEIGLKIVTTVLMNGEIETFVKSRSAEQEKS